jgi:hypothetical protein
MKLGIGFSVGARCMVKYNLKTIYPVLVISNLIYISSFSTFSPFSKFERLPSFCLSFLLVKF